MAKKDRQILRTVNINEELYAPGDEDALEEALDTLEEEDEDELFSASDEIDRLSAAGFLLGFTDVDDDETDGGNSDEKATRERRRATMQDAEKKPRARGAKKAAKSRPPKKQPRNPKEPGTSSAPADEAGEEANG